MALVTRPVIGLDDLPLELAMNEARDRFEQSYVLRALKREGWNQSRAARGLGVHRNTLLARLAAWGFRREEREGAPRPAVGAESSGRA